jgi:methyl-accepting chemotaxis protein
LASTSEELASQAEQLQASIGFFNVDGNGKNGGGYRRFQPVTKTNKVEFGHIAPRRPMAINAPVDVKEVREAGVALDMNEVSNAGDREDSDFESY